MKVSGKVMKQGQAVKANEVLYPFYWDYAGNPNVVVPCGAVGIVAKDKIQGDVIVDFPIDTSGMKNTIEPLLPVGKVWRVRMKLTKAANILENVDTPEWLKFHFFCGGLILDCELPRGFNHDAHTGPTHMPPHAK